MKRSALTPQSTFDLIETFPQPGCAICSLLLRHADRTLRGILYDRSVDGPTHDALRARRGLCSTHSLQITQYRGNAGTLAILFRSAVDEAVRVLGEMPEDPSSGRAPFASLIGARRIGAALAARLAPRRRCIVCEVTHEAEQRYLEVLASSLISDPRLLEAYQKSQGLCLPHVRMALAACDDPAVLRELIATQKRIWTQLRDDLDQFIVKADAHYGYADKGREGDAWLRAMKQLPGEDTLFGVDPREE